MRSLALRSGEVLEWAGAPGGLAPGEHGGLQVGGTCFWVRALDGPWKLTSCRSSWELSQWASLADSLEELLAVVGAPA